MALKLLYVYYRGVKGLPNQSMYHYNDYTTKVVGDPNLGF